MVGQHLPFAVHQVPHFRRTLPGPKEVPIVSNEEHQATMGGVGGSQRVWVLGELQYGHHGERGRGAHEVRVAERWVPAHHSIPRASATLITPCRSKAARKLNQVGGDQ